MKFSPRINGLGGMEYCFVSWKGVAKSLIVKTKDAKKNVNKIAYLEDVVKLLDDLGSGGGWFIRGAHGEKGETVWTLSRTPDAKGRKKKISKHLIIYWTGKGSRIEMYPRVLESKDVPTLNSAKLTDILAVLELLSMIDNPWIVSSSSCSKGAKIWTLTRIP